MKTGLRFLIAAAMLSAPLVSNAGMFVSVNIAPPPLLVYDQPPIPGDDYVWQPGYWAWDPDVEDYYWVPGTWVLAPEPGFYWTPGYWAWVDAIYVWHAGYWGPHIGYYGGINYGYGYWGHGYEGGYWRDNHFWYNRSVNNVTNVTNVYNTTVVNNYNNGSHVAFNGGNGGVQDRPRPEEEQAARERHFEHTDWQARHEDAARHDRNQFASHGDQVVAATPRPAAFSEHDVVRAQAPSNWDRGGRDSGRDDWRGRGNDNPRIDRGVDRNEAPGRVIDRRNADLDHPMQQEMPQTQRHPDRSQPFNESRPTPDVSPRERDAAPRQPHYERMRPMPRDDQPQREPMERPQRMERNERPVPQAMERGGGGGGGPPRAERIERPAQQARPQREPREGREDRRDHGNRR